MAIAIQPKLPIPDRTKQAIRSTKDQDGVIDIGWCDGVLSDGRAFRAEMWAQDQVSMLTFFFSSIGLEAHTLLPASAPTLRSSKNAFRQET